MYFLAGFVASYLGKGLPSERECCTGNVLFSVCQGDKSISTADAVSLVIDKYLAGNCLKNSCPPILASTRGCWYSNYYYNFYFSFLIFEAVYHMV